MKKALKWIGIIVGVLVLLIVAFGGYTFMKANSLLSKTYPELSGKNIYVTDDSATVERGRYVAETFAGCSGCHGRNLGGESIDAMPFAEMNNPNITFGKGGLPADYSIQDLDLSVRHGVKRDKTGAMLMPSFHLNRLADEDLAAVFAFLKTARKVDKTIPPYKLGPIGKIALATGGIVVQAEVADHKFKPTRPEIAPTVEYGKYVAEVGCMGCHGPNYSGGSVFEGDPSWPPATNLTKTLKQYNAESFATFMRTGKRHDGTLIDTRPMPTDIYRELADVEITAMWAYFSGLAPQDDASLRWPDAFSVN